eukprot:360329-Chlamydomonas_euryale.AAC.9
MQQDPHLGPGYARSVIRGPTIEASAGIATNEASTTTATNEARPLLCSRLSLQPHKQVRPAEFAESVTGGPFCQRTAAATSKQPYRRCYGCLLVAAARVCNSSSQWQQQLARRVCTSSCIAPTWPPDTAPTPPSHERMHINSPPTSAPLAVQTFVGHSRLCEHLEAHNGRRRSRSWKKEKHVLEEREAGAGRRRSTCWKKEKHVLEEREAAGRRRSTCWKKEMQELEEGEHGLKKGGRGPFEHGWCGVSQYNHRRERSGAIACDGARE